MNRQDDLRVLRTRKLIKEAFYASVKEKGFEKTTVSDITRRAMINRATFYLHYQDKNDLLRSLEDEVLADIEKICQSVTREYLEAYQEEEVPFPHIVELLSYIQENAEFFILTVRDNAHPFFYKRMGAYIYNRIFQAVFPELKSEEIFSKYAQTIMESVFSSIVNQWIKTGMQEPKEEIAFLITRLGRAFIPEFQKSLK